MTDLLTHVLAVYVLGSLLSWRIGIPERYVPVAMVGAVLPDLSKVHLVVSAERVTALLGMPFSWLPIHRLGGTALLVVGAALWFERDERRPALGALAAGAGSHYALDLLLKRADGAAPAYLYPLSWWRPPAGDLLLSSDLWPAIPAVVLAAAARYAGRRGRPED